VSLVNKRSTSSDNDLAKPLKELVNLNLIRALAIVMVVISHLPIPKHWIPEPYDLSSLGSLGVFIFFLHTATVLMMSLDRQRYEGANKLLQHFFIRRIMRIYPLSIVAVLIICFAMFFSGGEINLNTFISNLLLIQNLTHTPSIPPTLWSLPYEVQMYLVLPFIFLLLKKIPKSKFLKLFAAWIVAVVAIYGGASSGLNVDLIKFFPLFISGVMTYVLYDALHIKKFSPVFLITFCVALLFLFPVIVGFGVISLVLGWPTVLLLGVLLALSSEVQNQTTAALSKVLAQYSYAIYLIHFPLIDLVFNQMDLDFKGFKWILFFLLLALLSYLFHRWVEQPCIRIGKKWTAT